MRCRFVILFACIRVRRRFIVVQHPTLLPGSGPISLSTSVLSRSSAYILDEKNRHWPRRILVGEYRDEIFAALEASLEEVGCEVTRAVNGSAVAHQCRRISPDLLLINERLTDQSGWLTTAKLRLSRCCPPTWLYVARRPPRLDDWQDICGVQEVIEYGGVLWQLAAQIRSQLHRWRDQYEWDCLRDEPSGLNDSTAWIQTS